MAENLLNLTDEYNISLEGLKRLSEIYNKSEPTKHILWTDDTSVELPIRLSKSGEGSSKPITLIDVFQSTVAKFGNANALAKKVKGKWTFLTYREYYNNCCNFAKGLMSLQLTYKKSIGILGFNDPAWHISFFGAIFSGYIPVGIYTTNGPEACKYLVEHSESELVVVEDRLQLNKFLKIWDSLPILKYIVIYNDKIPEDLPAKYKGRVMLFNDILERGKKYVEENKKDTLQIRMSSQKPGHCCTIVYTSGTTGMPKGVMLSHDNYTFSKTLFDYFGLDYGKERGVSYLPLSHVAAQQIDIVLALNCAGLVYFADPSALQGTLVETLREVRPTFFFSVPRVWEKIEEKMKAIAAKNGFLKKSLATYAKKIGTDGALKVMRGEEVSTSFNLANKIIFSKIKDAIGLDQSKHFIFGAAPLSQSTINYFFSLNIFLNNCYGMSECAGVETTLLPKDHKDVNLKSAGKPIPGTDILIYTPDKDGNGEICWRGRNVFMGYFKNAKATRETLDENGYLHSGDIGKLDEKGNLLITGRLKELLITAGGENVAPVLIENEVKDQLKFISNAVVIGDNRKFLSILLTVKSKPDSNGLPTDDVLEECYGILGELNIHQKKISELIKSKEFNTIVQNGINEANKKAISNAAVVKKFIILDTDFTIPTGEMTPTLKLKRDVIKNKFSKQIESLYVEAKL